MRWIKGRIDFDGCFIVSTIGRGGGLALLRRTRVNVWVDSFSKYYIDSIINGGSESAWTLIGFYGELDTSRRDEGSNMLRMLGSKLRLPWCSFGDFNELLEVQDKMGGAPRAHNLMQNFHDILDCCGFVDLGFIGPDYTWHGRRGGDLI